MSSLKSFRQTPANHLLAALPSEEYGRMLNYLEPVSLPAGHVMYEAGGAIRYAYFLKSGIASLLSVTGDGRSVEVGMIGNEGMVGLPLMFGAGTTPYRVVAQLPILGARVRGGVLKAEFDRGGRLHDLLLCYADTLFVQISQSATCNRFHTMEERLCRWLLFSRDRAQTDTINFTQEFLSQMIGAPRNRVSLIAARLQGAGAIQYSRRNITIVDRARLEASACECYKVVSRRIDHFLAA